MDQINPIEVKDITLCILGNLGDHLCLTCSSIFLDAKIELIANATPDRLSQICSEYAHKKLTTKTKEEEESSPTFLPPSTYYSHYTVENIKEKLLKRSQNINCVFCLGIFSSNFLSKTAKDIIDSLDNLEGIDEDKDLELSTNGTPIVKIHLNITMPGILELHRIVIRGLITKKNDKNYFVIPTYDIILKKLLDYEFKKINSSSTSSKYHYRVHDSSNILTDISLNISKQEEIGRLIWPDLKKKTLKRKYGDEFEQASIAAAAKEESEWGIGENLNRATIDLILLHIKKWAREEFNQLTPRILDFFTASPASSILHIKLDTNYDLLYLFGRYRKFARDITQAPWIVSSFSNVNQPENSTSEENASNLPVIPGFIFSSDDIERKGRNSIEEIIGGTTTKHLNATYSRIHGCGREDMDVRCLGNGRPFIMEVIKSKRRVNEKVLKNIRDEINEKRGLNSMGDIDLKVLTLSSRNVWNEMQTKAEEKRKAYTCLVYTKDPITKVTLLKLENEIEKRNEKDPDGLPCLKLSQLTPLRVLHRRSLLNRERYVYGIKTALLNSHFFVMSIVTSAGTYVKEFVHSDLGRTSPSVSSILDIQSQILQLDVVWLYDDYQNLEEFSCDTSIKVPQYFSLSNEDTVILEDPIRESWEWLKSQNIVKIPEPQL